MAKMITVTVTEQHIKHGRPMLANKCALALAMKDAGIKVPCVDFLSPDGLTATGYLDGFYTHFQTSKDIAAWVRRFDRREPVQPCRVVLAVQEVSRG